MITDQLGPQAKLLPAPLAAAKIRRYFITRTKPKQWNWPMVPFYSIFGQGHFTSGECNRAAQMAPPGGQNRLSWKTCRSPSILGASYVIHAPPPPVGKTSFSFPSRMV